MHLNELKDILKNFESQKSNYIIWILANVNDTIQNKESFINHANFSEFFSKAEFASIASSIIESFGYVRIFYSETEFMEYVFNNLKSLPKDNIIIYNFMRDGIGEGKKSLIPAFCDLYGFKYISSNAFVISLLRNKFVYSKYLETLKIPVPFTLCSNMIDLELYNKIKGKEIIIKNIFESASIGLNENNVFRVTDYSSLLTQIKEFKKRMNSNNLLIQEFISGKECEVFVVKHKNKFFSFDPIMLNINNSTIITSSISDDYDYSFSPLSDEFSNKTCEAIKKSAVKSADFLNIKNYARFDYRITEDGDYYLIDIAGSPYLTRHSSISYLFTNVLELKYSDIFLFIAALTTDNYSHEVNCKSDTGKPLEE